MRPEHAELVAQEKGGHLHATCDHSSILLSLLWLLGGGGGWAGQRPVGNAESCQEAISVVLTKGWQWG